MVGILAKIASLAAGVIVRYVIGKYKAQIFGSLYGQSILGSNEIGNDDLALYVVGAVLIVAGLFNHKYNDYLFYFGLGFIITQVLTDVLYKTTDGKIQFGSGNGANPYID